MHGWRTLQQWCDHLQALVKTHGVRATQLLRLRIQSLQNRLKKDQKAQVREFVEVTGARCVHHTPHLRLLRTTACTSLRGMIMGQPPSRVMHAYMCVTLRLFPDPGSVRAVAAVESSAAVNVVNEPDRQPAVGGMAVMRPKILAV